MSIRSFYFYNAHIRKLLNSDLHLFEFSVWIQAFAQALISVFIPIILWKLGLSIRQIVIFYIIFNAFDVPLNIVARDLIVRFGAKIVLIISIVAQLLYLLTLFNLSNTWPQIIFLALMLAIFDAFYWVAHIFIFVQSAHASEQMRHDVGTLNIVRTVGGLFAPAIGGLLLIVSDYRTLIFCSAILMFASLIPLSRMRRLVFKPEVQPKPVKDFFRHPLEKFNYFFSALAAVQTEVEDVIWPFFVFFLFNSIRQVAYIPIIISLAGLVITYFTGKYSLKRNIYQLVSYGALLMVVLYLFRLFNLNSQFMLFATVFLIALSTILVDVPIDVAIFERGKKSDVLGASTYRNLIHMGARGLLYIGLLFVPDIFRYGLYTVIILMMGLFVTSLTVSLRIDKLEQLAAGPLEIEK